MSAPLLEYSFLHTNFNTIPNHTSLAPKIHFYKMPIPVENVGSLPRPLALQKMLAAYDDGEVIQPNSKKCEERKKKQVY